MSAQTDMHETTWRQLSAEEERAICALYCDRRILVAEILKRYGLHPHRLYRILKRNGCHLRRSGPYRRGPGTGPRVVDPASVELLAGPDSDPAAHRARIDRIEATMSAQMAGLQREASAAGGPEGEKLARALAQYTGALPRLRAYRKSLDEEAAPDDDGRPPRSLAELRDELRRHLERLRDERAAERLSEDPQPD